jgi:hypothetical protein
VCVPLLIHTIFVQHENKRTQIFLINFLCFGVRVCVCVCVLVGKKEGNSDTTFFALDTHKIFIVYLFSG